jgi:hypothetical protein
MEDDDDDLDEEQVYTNPRLDDLPELKEAGGATKIYRDAMKIFGSSAQRISLQNQHTTEIENEVEEEPESALVTESEHDSWLVDDLAPLTYKRKRPDSDVNNLFKTMGTRKKRREDDEKKKTSAVEDKGRTTQSKKRRSDERARSDERNVHGRGSVGSGNHIIDSEDFGAHNATISYAGEDREMPNSTMGNVERFPDDDIIDLELDATPSTAPSSRSSTSSLVRHTQQLKLTGFMSSNSANSNPNSASTSGYSSGGGRSDTNMRKETPAVPALPSVSFHLRIKVKIRGELLLIPVPNK